MPNTIPVTDSVETLGNVIDTAKQWGACRVYPTAAITLGQKGAGLCDYDALTEAGAVGFTDDGRPVEDSGIMLAAMERCAERNYLIISHCEELSLSRGGVMNDGRTSRLLGVKGITNAAEEVMIARDLILAEQTGCRLHVAHVSTAGGLRMIREAKKRGVRVTCETCPHYFSFCDEDVMFYGSNAKMNPPLRSREDVRAVIEAIADGTVDCVSTDHAPHTERDKNVPLAQAKNGITGLQTAFSAAMTYLVLPGHIDLYRLVELLSLNPARILGRDASLREGMAQSVTLVNPNREYVLDKSMLKRQSSTRVFRVSFYGTVENTFYCKKIYRANIFAGRCGYSGGGKKSCRLTGSRTYPQKEQFSVMGTRPQARIHTRQLCGAEKSAGEAYSSSTRVDLVLADLIPAVKAAVGVLEMYGLEA